jgi:hypothetical protein
LLIREIELSGWSSNNRKNMKKFLVIFASIVSTITLVTALPATAHMGEAHEVDAESAPKISLLVEKDEIGGFNVQIITENFTWAPENASEEHVPGEGHAHIYVDGAKVGRVYSSWYHLNVSSLNLEPGSHEVEVSLNSNDHGPYTVNGEEVRAVASIEVEQDESSAGSTKHAMGSQEMIDSDQQNLLIVISSFLLGALLSALGFFFLRPKRK